MSHRLHPRFRVAVVCQVPAPALLLGGLFTHARGRRWALEVCSSRECPPLPEMLDALSDRAELYTAGDAGRGVRNLIKMMKLPLEMTNLIV